MTDEGKSNALRVLPGGRARPPSDPLLDATLALMRREGPSASRAEDSADEGLGEAGRSIVERAAARHRRVLGMKRAALGTLAVAAAVALGITVAQDPERANPSARVELAEGVEARSTNERWSPLFDETVLASGSSVRTDASGQLALGLSRGGQLRLGPATRLDFATSSIAEKHQSLVLQHGTLELAVPPVGADDAFVVQTGRKTVLVHGAELLIHVAEEGAAACISVRLGAVEVRDPSSAPRWLRAGQQVGCKVHHEPSDEIVATHPAPKQVSAGASLPAPSPLAAQSAAPVVDRARAAGAVTAAEGEVAVETDDSEAGSAASELSEQNRIFQTALAAERTGELERARAELERLLREHPNSPLAGAARSELERLRRAP